MTRTGWRIVPTDHSPSAFDGEGARVYGGRWNSSGTPMVYASEHQSLAALEIRVHIDKTSMSKRYSLFAIHFAESLMKVLPLSSLPPDWRQQPGPQSLQRLGSEWVRSRASVILAVPSALIPNEMNYLINPLHSDFPKLKIDPPSDFAFDQRLFK